MASPQEKYRILSEPLHSRALQYSLNSLNRELARHTTNDPELIDGELLSFPLLCCLHIERYKISQTISISTTFADGMTDRCPLYKAWHHLMHTRFHG
jgi:hypothetical protein